MSGGVVCSTLPMMMEGPVRHPSMKYDGGRACASPINEVWLWKGRVISPTIAGVYEGTKGCKFYSSRV